MAESQVSRYYANRKILITGGTGFMGKVLVWKLLHSCPYLDTLYLLVRTKHGKNSLSRKKEILDSPIFDNFKKQNPEIFDKVVLISGDVAEQGIGLSDQDRDIIIEQVSIVFHGAAILKMNADLRTAINVNTKGMLRMLDLAQEMRKLEAFVYISTAYCVCDNLTIEERIYPSKHNPYDVINIVNWMDPEILAELTPNLIRPLPNTYVYSKRLTESLLLDYTSKIPIIVARPTIVSPAYEEPIPGWIDQVDGAAGLYIAGGKGVFRITMMKGDSKPNMIYVDTAINAILTLPWANSRETLLKEIAVYNLSQTADNDLTWRKIIPMLITSTSKYPFEIILWYPPRNGFTESVLEYELKSIFLHYLPAYVIDFIMKLIGRPPFLVRVQDKLRHGERVLRYFTKGDWLFSNEKIFQIEGKLSDADKRVFPVIMKKDADLQKYFDDATLATRRYIFKEDDKTIPASKIRFNIMYVVDKVFLLLRYYLLWKLVMFMFDVLLRVIELYRY